jgi:undecaprenyl-diphosphatase
MAFLETGAFIGLVAPGETAMLLGGLVAGQGRINVVTLIGIVWAAAVCGDVASFYAGRRLGRSFLERHGPKVQITEERIRTVEAFFARHGGKAILLGRFVGLVRAVNPFLAGSSGMAFGRFLPYSILGAGAWASMLLVLGYVFWRSFDQVLKYAERGTLALGTVIVVIVAVVWLVRHLRVPEHRQRLSARIDALLDRPVLRPVAAVVRPAWRYSRKPRRFIWNRITPGDLGLELTTLLAILAVGSFGFIAYGIEISGGSRIHGDATAFDIAADLRAGWLVDVAKVVTELGSLAVVGPIVLICVAGLLAWRRVAEAAALLSGMLVTVLAVHVAKDGFDRPRPSGALVDTANASFPSGHAAYAVAWVAIALIVTRTLPGFARPTAAIVVAVVVAVLVAATRVYLRAHYLSDVIGGAGLAASVFALTGLAALVISHLRHNGNRS